MRFLSTIIFSIGCVISTYAQIQVSQVAGSSIITKLGYGIEVNKGSSLVREFIILNDESCPVQLKETGINTEYSDRSYSFKQVGSITSKVPVTAYEIHYVLYNVFGEHIKSLSNKDVIEVDGYKDLSKLGSWYASENQVSEYLVCVSYVANVRTKEGKIWHYNYKSIKDQLNKLTISFDEQYAPQKDKPKE